MAFKDLKKSFKFSDNHFEIANVPQFLKRFFLDLFFRMKANNSMHGTSESLEQIMILLFISITYPKNEFQDFMIPSLVSLSVYNVVRMIVRRT